MALLEAAEAEAQRRLEAQAAEEARAEAEERARLEAQAAAFARAELERALREEFEEIDAAGKEAPFQAWLASRCKAYCVCADSSSRGGFSRRGDPGLSQMI